MHNHDQMERLSERFEYSVLADANIFGEDRIVTPVIAGGILRGGRHNVLELKKAVEIAESRVFGVDAYYD